MQAPHVLVVEDDPSNLRLIEIMLGLLGYRVEACGDGESAVTRCRGAVPPFDAVLMDIRLPVLSGFEAMTLIRGLEGYARTPIIGISAMADKRHVEAALAQGFDRYLIKPFTRAQLASILKEALERGPTSVGE